MNIRSRSLFGRPAGRAAVFVLLAALAAGCTQVKEILAPSTPGVGEEWASILRNVRAFERRFGFKDTDNFSKVSEDDDANVFCGYVSQFYLPHSYEDPAIRWRDAVSEQECLEHAEGGDVSFGRVETLGEVSAPLTPSIIDGGLDRFVYLVIHEDCHDQFALPYGVEEAVCDLITYKAMPVFGDENYGWGTRAQRAIRRYAAQESWRAHATLAYYEQLATLYARYYRKEVPAETVLRERAEIFAQAERALARAAGTMNNVAIANDMTYSRHYPLMEMVFEALGRDLARTVAFFRHVDTIKPARAAVMKQRRIASEESVEFIRAYEAAVVDTIKKALMERGVAQQ